MGVPVITTDYKPEPWLHAMHGMEREPEKGRRCQACFLHNLRATARKAKEMDIPWFTTSLTVSPHKVAADVFTAGQTASRETGVQFLAEDFKKRDGFKRSLELSNQMHLYRQKYCGCLFSLRVGDPV
jgi:predicted adenine nucleotide alpha hydrolase (AANH) superfamily ATPase